MNKLHSPTRMKQAVSFAPSVQFPVASIDMNHIFIADHNPQLLANELRASNDIKVTSQTVFSPEYIFRQSSKPGLIYALDPSTYPSTKEGYDKFSQALKVASTAAQYGENLGLGLGLGLGLSV